MCFSEVFDISLDTLSSYNTRGDKPASCDVCIRKGVVDNTPADTYCITCTERYCCQHRKV